MEAEERQKPFTDFLKALDPGEENAVRFVSEVVGDNKQLTVTFEQPTIAPPRRESQARAHTFQTVDSLIRYAQAFVKEDCVVLADFSQGEITMAINEKATNGREILRCIPQTHPTFAAWSNLLEARMAIGVMAQFMQAHRRRVIKPDGPELALTLSQVRLSKKVTVDKGCGRRAVNGLTCETHITGGPNTELIEIPETITVRMPFFVGEPNVDYDVDIILAEQENQVYAHLSSPDVSDKQLAEWERLVARIEDALHGVVGLGRLHYEKWDYWR